LKIHFALGNQQQNTVHSKMCRFGWVLFGGNNGISGVAD